MQRWEVTPGGSVPGIPVFPFVTWDTLETAINTYFPHHKICAGALIDADEGSPNQQGTAYYDLISIGTATFTDRNDLAGRGSFECKRRSDD